MSALYLAAFASLSLAQTRPRLPRNIDESSLTRLPGTTHLQARPAAEAGRADSDLPLDRMLLMLKSTPAQEAELDKLITSQHDPTSPLYRQWLTPEQFGAQFGPAQEDINTVVSWLQSKGFRINSVAAGRRLIEFSGSAGQVEQAFHTEMHHYTVGGVRHLANSTDISIPSSLVEVVAGVASLNDFHAVPLHHVVARPGSGTTSARTVQPLSTISNIGHALAPSDFATIYNTAALYRGGIDGAGQTIAIAGRSSFNMGDVSGFRASFGLPVNNPQIILTSDDPVGFYSADEELEASLDVEWSGAVAPNATIDFVLSGSTPTTGGETLSAEYAVDNNLAPVLSLSFGLCEAFLGSENDLYNSLWQQAAAQGISVIVAAGDNGSAGCDQPGSGPATNGFAVNGLASTPYNTAIGGTQLNEHGNPSAYWSCSMFGCATSYIPEVVWNDSLTPGSFFLSPFAGSGGISTLYGTRSGKPARACLLWTRTPQISTIDTCQTWHSPPPLMIHTS